MHWKKQKLAGSGQVVSILDDDKHAFSQADLFLDSKYISLELFMKPGKAPLAMKARGLNEVEVKGDAKNQAVELVSAMLDTSEHAFLLDDQSSILGFTVCTLYSLMTL